jgi:sulfur relay (sulfurtransferase) complex TusBCD TusD component (DsrE family)
VTDKTYAVMLNRDGMGQAEAELRHKLITTYLTMLLEGEALPAAVCLYAEGVRLGCAGSPVIELLRRLSDKGVPVILCSTCLGYFDLREKVQVGIVGGMHDIIEVQMRVDKVITL